MRYIYVVADFDFQPILKSASRFGFSSVMTKGGRDPFRKLEYFPRFFRSFEVIRHLGTPEVKIFAPPLILKG